MLFEIPRLDCLLERNLCSDFRLGETVEIVLRDWTNDIPAQASPILSANVPGFDSFQKQGTNRDLRVAGQAQHRSHPLVSRVPMDDTVSIESSVGVPILCRLKGD
jgi:hypothetical protein